MMNYRLTSLLRCNKKFSAMSRSNKGGSLEDGTLSSCFKLRSMAAELVALCAFLYSASKSSNMDFGIGGFSCCPSNIASTRCVISRRAFPSSAVKRYTKWSRLETMASPSTSSLLMASNFHAVYKCLSSSNLPRCAH